MNRRRLLRRALAALPLAVTVSASSAHAAPSEGERLFREGRAALAAGDYETACASFASSYAKDPAPGTALNLGECEEKRGRFVAAHEAFAAAAATFKQAQKRAYAASRAEAADRQTPRLVVHASVPIEGLAVRAGAVAVTLGVETKLDPGDVVVRAEAPGHRPKELPVTLRAAETAELDVGALAPEVDASEDEGATEASASPGSTGAAGGGLRTAGLVVGGVGAASVAVGVVTGVLALDRASTVEQRCTPDLVCDREGFDAARSGSTLSLVSTVTIAAGAAAIVGGAALFLLSPRSADAPTSARARLVPTASPGGAGVALFGAF